MKKVGLSFAAVIMLLFLFSCSNNGDYKSAVTDFSADAVITFGGDSENFSVTSNLGGITLTQSSGELEGINYICGGDKVIIEYADISVENDQSNFKSSMPYSVFSAIRSLRDQEELNLSDSGDESYILSGKNDVGDFTAEIDSSTGLIQKIEYSNGVSAKFSDIKEHK